ncbi:MAG: tetratricopeptide repeat protein [Leptolyngbyaceae cyanobacterium MO_188.B28]|nr:tetratricopeptide repeat protein [Leptolyngbyaceae cyanobacterium MO_188.B28]
MSSESPPPFAGVWLKQTTEAVASFIGWIAGLIWRRNWFMLLVLIGVALSFVGAVFKNFLNQALPPQHQSAFWILFWIAVGLSFVGALLVAVVTMPRPAKPAPEDVVERTAIKGLRPFGFADAEIFARLQRSRQLRECIEVLTTTPCRFVILMGESGCGKTSFLQAGIWPQLSQSESRYRGVYVRFSDQAPIDAIRKALADQLELPEDWLKDGDFLSLLKQAAEAAGKPVALLLDQFEQFFVHYQRPSDQQPFIQALTDWYRDAHFLPVKILVSIRSDLLFQLDELHKALGYTLGPQDVFHLKKLTPEESTNILGVIAETEQLRFDGRFVAELAEQELAHRENGLISPVDLQILAWMIERQNASELRAFNREAFQRFGGVEGLLTRFLDQVLAARLTTAQRQATVKVLLALTDLDSQVRAGVLTIPDLQIKLKGTVKPEEVTEATEWLARGDVRLITPVKQEKGVGYELAHERLIPALMRLAGKELSEADKANRLLDRRVNEWLGNQCDRRYLFGLRELWLLRQQQPYLIWGAKRRQKEKLLRLSWRRVYMAVTTLMAIAVVTVSVSSWLSFTTQGQIMRVEWQLERLLARTHASNMANAAVAFAKNEQWPKAFEITRKITRKYSQSEEAREIRDRSLSVFVGNTARFLHKTDQRQSALSILNDQLIPIAEGLQDDRSRSDALSAIANAATELNDPNRTAELLDQTLQAAQTIQNDFFKLFALSNIAITYAELNNPNRAAELLAQALQTAQTIQDDFFKLFALSAIASTYAELNNPNRAAELLAQVLQTAQTTQDNILKLVALRSITDVATELNDPNRVAELLTQTLQIVQTIKFDISKSNALRDIAKAAAELNDPNRAAELLTQALQTTQSIQFDHSKSDVLRDIAKAAAELNDPNRAVELLTQALQTTQTIQDNEYQMYTLSAIANASAELNTSNRVAELLAQALQTAQTIQTPWYKWEALRDITNAAAKLNDPNRAAELLAQALQTAQTIQTDSFKAYTLSDIANAYVELNDPNRAAELLAQALQTTQTIQTDSFKAYALIFIAKTYSRLNDPNRAAELLAQALQTTQTIQNFGDQSGVLSAIANSAAELNEPNQTAELLAQALQAAQTIQDRESKSDTLRAIVNAAAGLNNETQASELLKQIFQVAKRESASPVLKNIAILYAQRTQWKKALQALSHCGEGDRIAALTKVLTIWAEKQTPTLIEGAVVLQTEVTGNEGNYSFEVTIQSPDQNCTYHTNWWEILTPEGDLIKRQTLDNPHGDQASWSSQLSSVDVQPDQTLLIRAHFQGGYIDNGGNFSLNSSFSGYNNQALGGSINEGFQIVRLPATFAPWLEDAEPQPTECKQ